MQYLASLLFSLVLLRLFVCLGRISSTSTSLLFCCRSASLSCLFRCSWRHFPFSLIAINIILSRPVLGVSLPDFVSSSLFLSLFLPFLSLSLFFSLTFFLSSFPLLSSAVELAVCVRRREAESGTVARYTSTAVWLVDVCVGCVHSHPDSFSFSIQSP